MSTQLQQDHFKVTAQQKEEGDQYLAGRGAQFNTKNKFLKDQQTKEHIEGIDDWEIPNVGTQYLEQQVKHEPVCRLRAWMYLLLRTECS